MKKTNVLLIEDNDDHILITEKMLKYANEHCNIRVIKDGRQAIKLQEQQNQQRPDFILLDIDLPNASGIDVLKAYNAHSEWSKIPVWVLSNWEDDLQLQEAFELGIRGYFEKPLGRKGMESVKQLFVGNNNE